MLGEFLLVHFSQNEIYIKDISHCCCSSRHQASSVHLNIIVTIFSLNSIKIFQRQLLLIYFYRILPQKKRRKNCFISSIYFTHDLSSHQYRETTFTRYYAGKNSSMMTQVLYFYRRYCVSSQRRKKKIPPGPSYFSSFFVRKK